MENDQLKFHMIAVVVTKKHIKLLYNKKLLFEWVANFDMKIDDIALLEYILKDDDQKFLDLWFYRIDRDIMQDFLFFKYITAIKCQELFLSRYYAKDLLITACIKGYDLSVIQLIYQRKGNINFVEKNSNGTPLAYALWWQPKELIIWMVQNGAKFWDASESVTTEIERSFFMKLTNCSSWENACKNLSIRKQNLRKRKLHYGSAVMTFLYRQLICEAKYKEELDFFIKDISLIIEDYLILDKPSYV